MLWNSLLLRSDTILLGKMLDYGVVLLKCPGVHEELPTNSKLILTLLHVSDSELADVWHLVNNCIIITDRRSGMLILSSLTRATRHLYQIQLSNRRTLKGKPIIPPDHATNPSNQSWQTHQVKLPERLPTP